MKTKAAVCGYGPMGRMHAQILGRIDEVELVGAADVQPELQERARRELGVEVYSSGEDLIDAGIADVIWVCTPTYLHAPLAVRALEQGIHVFTEKPMALTVAECDAMIEASRRNGKLLTVGQVLRFWPEYVYLQQTLADGRLGALTTLSMLRIGGMSRGYQDWYLDLRRGGTQLFDRHLHDTDLCVWLFGVPEQVVAWGREAPVGGFHHTWTRYVYPELDGAAVNAEGSADLPGGFPFTMAFLAVFENGALEYSNRNQPTLVEYHADGTKETPELPQPLGELDVGLNITSAGAYYLEDVYFIDCVRKGVPSEVVPPESARDTIRVVCAEVESARSGEARQP